MITNTVTRLLLAVAVLAAATLAAPHGHAALMARFAKQLGVHPRKIGKQLLARATSAIEKGELTTPTLRAAAAGGSKDYAAIYMHASPNCTDSPFVAMAVRADTCFNVGSGNNALSYYTSCGERRLLCCCVLAVERAASIRGSNSSLLYDSQRRWPDVVHPHGQGLQE